MFAHRARSHRDRTSRSSVTRRSLAALGASTLAAAVVLTATPASAFEPAWTDTTANQITYHSGMSVAMTVTGDKPLADQYPTTKTEFGMLGYTASDYTPAPPPTASAPTPTSARR